MTIFIFAHCLQLICRYELVWRRGGGVMEDSGIGLVERGAGGLGIGDGVGQCVGWWKFGRGIVWLSAWHGEL